MKPFRASRVRSEGKTIDIDRPILNAVYFQTVRRLPYDQAVERLVKDGYLNADKEFKRAKAKEDALIKALKTIGGIFMPDPPRKKR